MKDNFSAMNGDLIFSFTDTVLGAERSSPTGAHDKSHEAAQAIKKMGSSIHGCQGERDWRCILSPAAGNPRKRFEIGTVLTRYPTHRLAA